MFKRTIVVAALVSLGVIAAVACTPTGAQSSGSSSPSVAFQAAGVISQQQTGIWVSGLGKVSAQPDLAILSLSVEVRAKTVAEAQSRAASSMNAVIAALKKRGVQDKDIQTRYFNVSPQYNYVDKVDQFGRRSEQVLVGYIVSNQATVKARKLDDVGPLLDDVATAGGDLTRVQGITFTIDDPTKLQDQARELAVKNATAKAQQVAKAAGVSLGRAFYIAENVSFTPRPQLLDRGFAAAPASEASTPISGGELDVQVTVQAAFAIQ